MQIENVFVNVSKGQVAPADDLQKAFGTTEIPKILQEILKKGELQVGEKERQHELSNTWKDIATQVAEKCVDPGSQRPYTVGMIEKAMHDVHYSVKTGRSAKQQVRFQPTLYHSILTHTYVASPLLNRHSTSFAFCRKRKPSPSNVPACASASPCPTRTAKDQGQDPTPHRQTRGRRLVRPVGVDRLDRSRCAQDHQRAHPIRDQGQGKRRDAQLYHHP